MLMTLMPEQQMALTDKVESRRTGAAGWFVPLLLAHAGFNLLQPAALAGSRCQELEGILEGIVVGQIGAVAIWAVFAPPRPGVRLLLSALITVLLYSVLTAGAAMSRDTWMLRLLMESMPAVPIVLLSVQLPLWGTRLALGWRIIAPGGEKTSSAARSRQFSSLHVLGAVTLVAVAVGLARPAYLHESYPTRLFVALTAYVFWGALLILPCLWTGLVVRRWVTAAIITVAYSLALTLPTSWVVSIYHGYVEAAADTKALTLPTSWVVSTAWSGSSGGIDTVVLCMHLGIILTLFGSLRVVRNFGYRLYGIGLPNRPRR